MVVFHSTAAVCQSLQLTMIPTITSWFNYPMKYVANHGPCPVQICNNFLYVRHVLIGARHWVRHAKIIYFKAFILLSSFENPSKFH